MGIKDAWQLSLIVLPSGRTGRKKETKDSGSDEGFLTESHLFRSWSLDLKVVLWKSQGLL